MEFTGAQLSRIVHVYARLLHDPAITISLHTLFAKMIYHTVDAIVAKDTVQGAAKTLTAMFETSLDRLEALTIAHDEILVTLERTKNGDPPIPDRAFIEKARPVGGSPFAIDKPEDVLVGQCRPFIQSNYNSYPFTRISSAFQDSFARVQGVTSRIKKD